MALFTFLLIFSYVMHDLYFYIVDAYIDSQTIKLITFLIVSLLTLSVILTPVFFKNINSSIFRLIYIFLFILVLIFCFLVLNNVILIFKINNFLLTMFIFLICLTTFYIYGYFNNKIKITRYNLKTDKKISIKLAFVSDIHIGNKGTNEKQIKKIVSTINNENPDLLLFGGDLVENEKVFDKTENYTKIIQEIKTKNIYGVLGNHELHIGNNVDNIVKLIKNNYRINILQDDVIKIGNLILVGRVDNSSKNINIKRKSIKKIIGNLNNLVDADSIRDNYILVLDHNPVEFTDSLNNNIDLQLSGHTHGGQFFPFNLINSLLYGRKNYGLQRKKNSNLIVSSGIGTSGIPLRAFTKKEVIIVEINN